MTVVRRDTQIGRVRHVLGSTVTIELDKKLAGVAPIWEGQLQPIGQIGSLIRIPQGPTSLIGTVILVGISEIVGVLEPVQAVSVGDRWLKVQLIGEVNALGEFVRGVSTYPGLDDSAHFATARELAAIYPEQDDSHVVVGSLSAAPEVKFALRAERLVTRHSSIVGSTGSGKTSAVVTIVQNLVRSGWATANIIIVDPHGEYSAALSNDAAVESVLDPSSPLRVPYWALPSSDVLRAIARVEGQTFQSHFAEAVVKAKRAKLPAMSSWLQLDPMSVNQDTPIPYDIREVWFDLDFANRATLRDKTQPPNFALLTSGSATALESATFEPYSQGAAAPYKGPLHGSLTPVPERMKLALEDRRLHFFLDSAIDISSDPFPGIVKRWLGEAKPVSVLDFSGVPSSITDVAVGGIAQTLFDIASRCTDVGIGFPNPILIVLEEAHRYLGKTESVRMARDAVDRIAREGRKHGVGIMLVSQRPSELPDTALSQVGTIVALRLTNQSDQSTVKAALPDAVAGLADALPALRNGEALVSGESAVLPSRVMIDKPKPPPDAADPSLAPWRLSKKALETEAAVRIWRGGN